MDSPEKACGISSSDSGKIGPSRVPAIQRREADRRGILAHLPIERTHRCLARIPEAEIRPLLQLLDEAGIGADNESAFAHPKNLGGVKTNDCRDRLRSNRIEHRRRIDHHREPGFVAK